MDEFKFLRCGGERNCLEAEEFKFCTRSNRVLLNDLLGSIQGISQSGLLITITLGLLGDTMGGVQPVGANGVVVGVIVLERVEKVDSVVGGNVNGGGVVVVTMFWHSKSQLTGINGKMSARKFAREHPPTQPGIGRTCRGSKTEYS